MFTMIVPPTAQTAAFAGADWPVNAKSPSGSSARLGVLAAVFLCFALMAGPAGALPAPMSDSELLSESDLVALIRVLSVTCTSVAKDERTGEELPSYSARAELMEVIKGDEVKGDDVTISFHAIPTGMVWTHLTGKEPTPRPGGTAPDRQQRRHHRLADHTR
jgi:hypothetical protein